MLCLDLSRSLVFPTMFSSEFVTSSPFFFQEIRGNGLPLTVHWNRAKLPFVTFIAPFIDDGSKTGPPAIYEYKIRVNE